MGANRFLKLGGLNWIRAVRKLFLSPPPSSYPSPLQFLRAWILTGGLKNIQAPLKLWGGLDINWGA